jgi:hypothetical protein
MSVAVIAKLAIADPVASRRLDGLTTFIERAR